MKVQLLGFLLLMAACHNGNNRTSEKTKIIKVNILPLGRIDDHYVKETYDKIHQVVGKAVLLPARPMPAMAYYKPRNRYRADSLIRWMSSLAHRDEIYIGVTTFDISTTKGAFADYGVMGLGYCPGKACIVSSHRLKNKQHFYKLVIHELGHNMGLQHCPEPTRFMRDAKGGDHTGDEKSFCEDCSRTLQKKGWKL